MKIEKYSFDLEGMKRVYENSSWMVGIKNWKPSNDISGIDCLERHNKTDELFVLIAGSCTLVSAIETDSGIEINAIEMESNHVYNIPKGLWHNTVTKKDTKLILIEDSSTSMDNSDIYDLSAEEISIIKESCL